MLRSIYLSMKDKFEKFLDNIYAQRAFYLRYLITATVLSIARYFLGVLMSGVGFAPGDDALVAWFIWAALFFTPLKLWVFRNRCDNIYLLLTQIMKFIFCIAILWIARGIILFVFVMLSNNATVALSIGGIIVELICLALMINIVFKKPKS